MIAYHGTTRRRAQRICQEGFLPRRPSRRVWFAQGHGYALRRAKTQARRSRDRPVVLTCELDMVTLRNRLGRRRVFHRGGIIAVDGPVPVSVVRSHPGWENQPTSPRELARWVNDLLHLKQHKGVSPKHPGAGRLSKWVVNRITSRPNSRLKSTEILHWARQWLPEFFDGVTIDPESLHAAPKVATVDVVVDADQLAPDPREARALELLEDPRPRKRSRGLELLAELADPDLAQWCAMFLDDESPDVQVTALRMLVQCEDADTESLLPLAASQDRRIRGGALAALARHGGDQAARWFERGLKDPSPCVRVQTARQLPHLDPVENRDVFQLALYDANLQIVAIAEKLVAGKGYPKVTW